MNIQVIHTGPLQVNTFIVSAGGSDVFIVDPAACSFSNDADKIISFLSERSLNPVAIVLTHGHFDHVCGLKNLKEHFENLPVLIHQKDAGFIGADSEIFQSEILIPMGGQQFVPCVTNLPEPDAFLRNGKTLLECIQNPCSASVKKTIPEETKKLLSAWTVLHTPGHSEGSVCLYNESERSLISGDTLFYHSYGRTDLKGGSETEIWKSIKFIKHEIPENTKVYPGHDYEGFLLQDGFTW